MDDNTLKRYNYISFQENKYRRFDQNSNEKNIASVIDEKPNEESHGSYGALLFDPRWRERRKEILLRDANVCVNCSSSLKLQVHHRQYHFITKTNHYKMPWDYASNLLITLCEKCHQNGHSKFKVPTIKI